MQHLKQVAFSSPLFNECKKAYPISNPNEAKYLIVTLPNTIVQSHYYNQQQPFKKQQLKSKLICRYYIDSQQNIGEKNRKGHTRSDSFGVSQIKNRLVILTEGQSLFDYVRAKYNSQSPITQEQLWPLLKAVGQSLLQILEYDKRQHGHVKQYALRIINIDRWQPQNSHNYEQHFHGQGHCKRYKVIYHPTYMNTALDVTINQFQAAKQKSPNKLLQTLKKYYLSPQETQYLKQLFLLQQPHLKFKNQYYNSSVFSLGMLILNMMLPNDHDRSIYGYNPKEELPFINKHILEDKLQQSERRYSKYLVNIIRNCVVLSPQNRFTTSELIRQIDHNLAKINHKRQKLLQKMTEQGIIKNTSYWLQIQKGYNYELDLQNVPKKPTKKLIQETKNKVGKSKLQKVDKKKQQNTQKIQKITKTQKKQFPYRGTFGYDVLEKKKKQNSNMTQESTINIYSNQFKNSKNEIYIEDNDNLQSQHNEAQDQHFSFDSQQEKNLQIDKKAQISSTMNVETKQNSQITSLQHDSRKSEQNKNIKIEVEVDDIKINKVQENGQMIQSKKQHRALSTENFGLDFNSNELHYNGNSFLQVYSHKSQQSEFTINKNLALDQVMYKERKKEPKIRNSQQNLLQSEPFAYTNTYYQNPLSNANYITEKNTYVNYYTEKNLPIQYAQEMSRILATPFQQKKESQYIYSFKENKKKQTNSNKRVTFNDQLEQHRNATNNYLEDEISYQYPLQIPQPKKDYGYPFSLDICLGSQQNMKNIISDSYKNDKQSALGVRIDGNIYFGKIVGGRRVGLGLQLFPNSQYYFGQFKEDLFHGIGFYFWNIHQYFLGQFQSGQKVQGYLHGIKSEYDGTFNNGRRHGKGSCWYLDQSVYIGDFSNGKRQGKGILIQPTGDYFIGQFSKNKKKGKGSHYSLSEKIIGIWDGDQVSDQIQIYEKSGGYYKGRHKNLERHGQGNYYFKNGDKFSGTFEQGMPCHGLIEYKNGQKYYGLLNRDMKRHGYGEYTYLNGEVYKGGWSNGRKTKQA